jgi:hypothetical protein
MGNNITAVDFFGNNMAILFFKLESKNITQEEFNIKLYNLFQQSNEIFKQQIIDARVNGVAEGIDIGSNAITDDISKNHEIYYNEKYNKNEK